MNWFKCLFLSLSFYVVTGLTAQDIVNIQTTELESTENVQVKKLSNSIDASSFLIEIKDTIKPHFHKVHTELIYVVSGEARFYFAEEIINIKTGDYFEIPREQIHAVKVTSEEPLKVLSVQAPEFKGEDRIFID